MDKKNISLEARRALNEFKVEAAAELNVPNKHLYDLKSNLTPSDSVTKQLVETREKSRKNPNNSFSDFLGKGF